MKKNSFYLQMSNVCKYAVLVISLVWLDMAQAEQQFVLTEAQWSRPRSAAVVRSYPAVQKAVEAWRRNTSKQNIELRYPGGEEGSLWAEELKDWLVAMGIPSDQLETYPGHPVPAELALVVLP